MNDKFRTWASHLNSSYYKNKKRIDVFFKENDITYTINSSNQFVFDKCPFCERENKLYFNPDNTAWLCFRCGKKGNIISLISDVSNIPRAKVVELLDTDVERIKSLEILEGKSLIETIDEGKIKEEEEIKFVYLPRGYRQFLFTKEDIQNYREFYLYLIYRGIIREMVELFNIHFSINEKRIVFPIYYNRRLVGYQGRLISNLLIRKGNPKALTGPTGYKKAKFLFNYDNARDKEAITIVEGPIDACKAYKHNPIALFGKTLSQAQLNLIKGMNNLKLIYLGLDPEENKGTKDLYTALSPYYDCKLLSFEKGTDCGDKSIQEIDNYFNNARNYDFLKIGEG